MTGTPHNKKYVSVWLVTIYMLIVAMVAVGGITRLTDSGLSIVDWRPITGILPPLSEEAWLETFGRYQTSPEFRHVHHWMALADFKRIFFWEYFHRLLARFLALVTLVGWIGFVGRGVLRGRWVWRTGLIFGLGAVQGGLGWFMVKSGLTDVPTVSHFRLAAHLVLAFATAQWVLWLLLDWRAQTADRQMPDAARPLRGAWWSLFGVTLMLLLLQIVFGAFVAGTDAGVLFATFPDVNGTYSPAGFFTHWSDTFTNPVTIHYVHRALAFLFLLPLTGLVLSTHGAPRIVRRAVLTVAGLTAVQFVLGALTVVWHVPVSIAVAHQCTALFVLSSLVHTAFVARAQR